jgi:hypothetical protein
MHVYGKETAVRELQVPSTFIKNMQIMERNSYAQKYKKEETLKSNELSEEQLKCVQTASDDQHQHNMPTVTTN